MFMRSPDQFLRLTPGPPCLHSPTGDAEYKEQVRVSTRHACTDMSYSFFMLLLNILLLAIYSS